MNENSFAYSKQQTELQNVFELLKRKSIKKIKNIKEGNLTESDFTRAKNTINSNVENLHLAVSNYFGDCDRRKLRIEAAISEKIDIQNFKKIGEQILLL